MMNHIIHTKMHKDVDTMNAFLTKMAKPPARTVAKDWITNGFR